MRLTVLAIGRQKAEERLLAERYHDRATKLGNGLGLTLSAREMVESRASRAPDRRREEAAALASGLSPGAFVVALDERGRGLTSEAFAERLRRLRDDGTADVVFLLGGADGLDPGLVDRAGLVLAFGPMTWPHQLARTMLAEQLYRAMTIIAGHPYHRGE